MNIPIRKEQGVSILDLSGIDDGGIQLRKQIQGILSKGDQNILINMKGMQAIDSAGLGELVRLQKTVTSAGGNIKLLHVEDKVQAIFEIENLIGVFETFDNEFKAIASFRS